MAATIVKGDEMQLFIDGKTIGYCTTHSFEKSAEFQDIGSKDHGLIDGKELNKITWTCSAEAYYTDADYDTLSEAMDAGTPIDIIFAHVKNYDSKGLKDIGEGTVVAWTQGAGYKGKAVITSLSGSFNHGERATFSVQFEGTSTLSKVTAQAGG